MKRLAIAALFLGLWLVGKSFAQSGAVIPQGGAGHAPQASCVILKRMGPADEITSHLYSFGIRGKQFQYVEGKLPEGFPFHGRLTDHDVRNLQGRGAEVIVMNQNFTADDLKQARDQCRGETGKTQPSPTRKRYPHRRQRQVRQVRRGRPRPRTMQPPQITQRPLPPQTHQQLQVSSTPVGADIEIDGSFIGNTPSTVGVAPGAHQLSVKKTGFKPWERKITVSSGQVNVNAVLEADVK